MKDYGFAFFLVLVVVVSALGSDISERRCYAHGGKPADCKAQGCLKIRYSSDDSNAGEEAK